MRTNKSAATMKDVAREAGVSLGTVSKVVNGLPVGKAYQKRVIASIEKLDYHINSYAKGLKTNKTYTIALLVPNTCDPFFGILTYHINTVLAKKGYRMLLCATNGDQKTEQVYVDMAQQNKVDGIICLSYNEALLVPNGTPLVTIDRHINGQVPCISSDNFHGGQIAAETLIRLGCKHLVYLSSGSRLVNEPTKRGDGFRSYCSVHQIEHEVLSLYDGDPFSAFTDFLDGKTKQGQLEFDGIFCVNDLLAVKIIRYLRKQGIRIPEDVQVIGFDGIRDYFSESYPCSTIVQPLTQLAEVSVNMVLSEDWSVHPPLVCLPVKYAYGGTTKEEPLLLSEDGKEVSHVQ